jgi:hypothetical protein
MVWATQWNNVGRDLHTSCAVFKSWVTTGPFAACCWCGMFTTTAIFFYRFVVMADILEVAKLAGEVGNR